MEVLTDMGALLGLERWHVVFLIAPIIPYYLFCFIFHVMDQFKGLEKYRVQQKVFGCSCICSLICITVVTLGNSQTS